MKRFFSVFAALATVLLSLAGCTETANPVSSVSITEQNIQLIVGETRQMTLVVDPEDASSRVIWTVSDDSVLSVDENGMVTANSMGVADVIATVDAVSGKSRIYVGSVPVSGVTVDKHEMSLTLGENGHLDAIVNPEQVEDKTVVWSSSNENVALVDVEGNVYSVGLGDAYIKASAGEFADSCLVTVSGVPVESISIEPSELELSQGETYKLSVVILPENATDQTVTWTSSDNSKVSVDALGKITAVSSGNATITAKCGDRQATCEVSVLLGAPNLGDYYYADGTYSTELAEGKEAIGIIFYLDETGRHGKIVSLKESEERLAWGPETQETGATDSEDGENNLNTIKEFKNWEESFPAFKYCDDLNDGGLQWYMGSEKEMRYLFAWACGLILTDDWGAGEGYVTDWGNISVGMPDYNNEKYVQARNQFNQRLEAAGGKPMQAFYYHTSTESSGRFAYYCQFKSGLTRDGGKKAGWFIRPMAKF